MFHTAAGIRVVIKTEEPHSDDCPEDCLEQHQMSGSSEGDFPGLDQEAPCGSPYSATLPLGDFTGNSLEEAGTYDMGFGEIKRVTVQHNSCTGKDSWHSPLTPAHFPASHREHHLWSNLSTFLGGGVGEAYCDHCLAGELRMVTCRASQGTPGQAGFWMQVFQVRFSPALTSVL